MKAGGNMRRRITTIILTTVLALLSLGMTKAMAAPEKIVYSFEVTSNPVCAFSGRVTYPSDSLEILSVRLIGQSSTQYAISKNTVTFNGSETANSFDFSKGAELISIEFKVLDSYDKSDIKTRLDNFYTAAQCTENENEPFYFSEYINRRLFSKGYFNLDKPLESYIDSEEFLPDEPEENMKGDVNGDGKITVDDVTLVQKAVAEITELDAIQEKAADVNADGKVSVDDATMIQKYVAEIIDRFE